MAHKVYFLSPHQDLAMMWSARPIAQGRLMKFDSKSPIDAQHCLAIKHEYLRCRDAFTVFHDAATGIVLSGHTREAAYRAYNAYSSFILHLYEFIIALHARDLGDTEVVSKKAAQKAGWKREEVLDALVNRTTHQVVQSRVERIERGEAPSYENALSYYTQLLPLPAPLCLRHELPKDPQQDWSSCHVRADC